MNTPNEVAINRNQIAKKKREIGDEAENERCLTRELQAVNNWLHGHPWDDETLKNNGLLREANSKKGEAQILRGKIAQSKQRLTHYKEELRALEAIVFNEDQIMEAAMTHYTEALQSYSDLQDRERSMKEEKGRAVEALNNANTVLATAQSAKRKSLSLAEVSKASEDEAVANRKIEELTALVENLDGALSPLSRSLPAALVDLNKAESAVWDAKCKTLLVAVRETAQSEHLTEAIEAAFAAWVRAGHVALPEQFFRQAFVETGALNFAPDHIALRQADIGKELGLTSPVNV